MGSVFAAEDDDAATGGQPRVVARKDFIQDAEFHDSACLNV